MVLKILNHLLHRYMWVYEREDGDRGFVLARDYEDAVNKLASYYTDAANRIRKTNEDSEADNWMYLYDADHTEIHGDIFVTQPY